MRFHVIWICLRLFQVSIEWFRTLRPISGGMDGWDGWDGWLSRSDGLLRAPYGANNPMGVIVVVTNTNTNILFSRIVITCFKITVYVKKPATANRYAL